MSSDPWDLYRAIRARSRVSFFLDSVHYQKPNQVYSYIGANPFLEVVLKGNTLRISGEKNETYPAAQLLPVLRKLFKQYATKSKTPFFSSGAVGFWGYELAPYFEKIRFRNKPAPGTPILHLGFYRDVKVYDHQKKKWASLSLRAERSNLNHRSKTLSGDLDCFVAKNAPRNDKFYFHHFKPEITKRQFEKMVRKAKAYIAAGDIYQANLSQRFHFGFKGSPLNLYGALRKINPSPFASFLDFGDYQILSSSPERLVQKKGRMASTRPIAGTRPRKSSNRELLRNEKERAEHIMLLDLERNDLGRVCHYKSVKVTEMMGIEKYSHVIHIVSEVQGKLRQGKDGLDLLASMFPGGTITGCPKVRCMEIIDELEPVQRGIYTGSIGYWDFRGDLDLNIVIRTLILQKNKGYFQTGAGIVHDSDPAREYEETLYKGEAMAAALVAACHPREGGDPGT